MAAAFAVGVGIDMHRHFNKEIVGSKPSNRQSHYLVLTVRLSTILMLRLFVDHVDI